MAYIGNVPAEAYSTLSKQTITGDGGTSYTLDYAVATAQDIEVFVNNVRQEPGVAYTVAGTALTMTGAVSSSDDFYVVFQGKAVQTVVPADNTVTTAMLQDGVVTAGKLNSTLDLTGKTVTLPAGVGGKFVSYAVLADEKGATTSGGTFTSGAMQTRDLNTERFDPDGIVSISSNQFTLQAGTYFIRWSCPVYSVDRHNTRLFNATDTTSVADGSSEVAASGSNVGNRSFGSARVTIASAKAFEIQHRCQTTLAGNGFGVDVNSQASVTTFTIVEIFKEA